jgi:D-amino peptidase
MLKVFISADMEGISGVANWPSTQEARDVRDDELQRKRMTMDVNAAIEGAFKGGAEEIVVNDSHGRMRNLLIEELDERAKLIQGSPKPLSMMQGIDSSYSEAFMIGYHARAGTEKGVLNHTFTLGVDSIRMNGVPVGELGVNSAIAGYFNVPVALVAGDQAVIKEAQDLLGKVETVQVKEGITRTVALFNHVNRAHRMISEAAERAVKRVDEFSPFKPRMPLTLEVQFAETLMADVAEQLPFVKRAGPKSVKFTERKDYLRAFKALWSIIVLGEAYRIRF